mgnify:CR=1 FL=1
MIIPILRSHSNFEKNLTDFLILKIMSLEENESYSRMTSLG